MRNKEVSFKCRNYNKIKGFNIGEVYNAKRKISPYFPEIKTFEVYSPERDSWVFLGGAVFGRYFNINGCNNDINPFRNGVFKSED